MSTATGYTLTAATTLPFADAVERVRAELKEEGFGVLCEIDVQSTLREKLGVEREPYTILGACNPMLAHEALTAEPQLGTLLPCNVVVYERDGERVARAMAELQTDRRLAVGDDALGRAREVFDAARVEESEVAATMAEVLRTTGQQPPPELLTLFRRVLEDAADAPT